MASNRLTSRLTPEELLSPSTSGAPIPGGPSGLEYPMDCWSSPGWIPPPLPPQSSSSSLSHSLHEHMQGLSSRSLALSGPPGAQQSFFALGPSPVAQNGFHPPSSSPSAVGAASDMTSLMMVRGSNPVGYHHAGASPQLAVPGANSRTSRSSKTYHCRMCNEEFVGKSGLWNHTHEKHSQEDKAHKCAQCFKTFPTPQQLAQHTLVHSNLRKYKCSFCEKAFKQLCHLQQHQRRHTGDRPYKCPMSGCSKAFAQQSNLKQHLKNHSSRQQDGGGEGSKLHVCHICNQHLDNELSLLEHICKNHVGVATSTTGERRCSDCSKTFADDGRYLRHLYKNHPDSWRHMAGQQPIEYFLPPRKREQREKKFACKFCHRKFSQETGLVKHLATHPEAASMRLQVFPCRVCRRLFTRETYLERHVEMKTDEAHVRLWQTFRRHMMTRHQQGNVATGASPMQAGIGEAAAILSSPEFSSPPAPPPQSPHPARPPIGHMPTPTPKFYSELNDLSSDLTAMRMSTEMQMRPRDLDERDSRDRRMLLAAAGSQDWSDFGYAPANPVARYPAPMYLDPFATPHAPYATIVGMSSDEVPPPQS